MKLTAQQSNKVQILRGLAIIAVVLIHNTPGGLAQVFCRPFLNFCVGLFLFLSGLLSSAEKWSPKKRIVKVLIPYVLWTVIYTVMYNLDNLAQIPVTLAKNLITAKSCAQMYYIFVYCTFTLLIPLIDKLAKSKYKYWGFAIAPVEILLMRLLPSLAGFAFHPYLQAIIDVSFLGWFTYFYLGYLIGNGLMTMDLSQKKLLAIWGIAMVAQMGEGYLYYTLGNTNLGTQLKLTAVFAGVFFCLLAYRYIMSQQHKDVKVLALLGNYSFGIYFSHIAIMDILARVPYYAAYVPYPINGLVVIGLDVLCIYLGKKILGKYSSYLAL